MQRQTNDKFIISITSSLLLYYRSLLLYNSKFIIYITSLLLLNNFYPVISYRRVQKKATNYCIIGSVVRYGPQSVARTSGWTTNDETVKRTNSLRSSNERMKELERIENFEYGNDGNFEIFDIGIFGCLISEHQSLNIQKYIQTYHADTSSVNILKRRFIFQT